MKKRVVVYVDAEEHKQLKARLALLGQSVSGWFRDKMKAIIKETK